MEEIQKEKTAELPTVDYSKLLETELLTRGFSKEQIQQIKEATKAIEENQQEAEIELLKKEAPKWVHKLLDIVDNTSDRIISLYEADRKVVTSELVVTLVIIVALFALASLGHLEPTHTATLFGGLIGYVLGNKW